MISGKEPGQADGLVVVLGTGGTIAGVSTTGDDRAYQAAQLSVKQLVSAVSALAGQALETHQVVQVDSKDMGWPVWQVLLAALLQHLARPEVAGVVVTHGTDTLEETALLLHLLLPPGKPVVLTAAMRPASSLQADGPANLRDAVQAVAALAARSRSDGEAVGGVAVLLQGRLWSALDLRKAHSWHIDAFDGGGAEALALVGEGGALAWTGRTVPRPKGWHHQTLTMMKALPRVELITSHADADGALVDALLLPDAPPGLEGLLVACTGHGTVHHGLEAALLRAESAGVAVWKSTRVAQGGVTARDHDRWPSTGALTPSQARLALAVVLAVRPELLGRSWAEWGPD